MSVAASLVGQAYPDRVPKSLQFLFLLTEDDEGYLIIALDTTVDRFITAGTVTGIRLPSLPQLPEELDFVSHVIVSDDLVIMEPLHTTPDDVNRSPASYVFKRVKMDTTYLFSGARIKDAPPSLDRLGFGLATDELGSSSRDDYLTVIDPYNSETQLRVAELTGTVLFPTEGMRSLLSQLYRFASDDIAEALNKPSVFYEGLVDDEAQSLTISQLMPTIQDPELKLHRFHGEMVSIQGLALGGMVRTEDIPKLQDLPVQITFKLIGVADLTGAMPIFGLSSEDVSGEVFGFFRFDLSVYAFDDRQAFAFLIRKEAVPLDPITEVERAEFGERVKLDLSGYLVAEVAQIQVTEDLILEQVDFLEPTKAGDPLILTRHPELVTGDFLTSLTVDGYLIDGRLIQVPEELIGSYGLGVVVTSSDRLTYEIGALPVPIPIVTVTPLPIVLP